MSQAQNDDDKWRPIRANVDRLANNVSELYAATEQWFLTAMVFVRGMHRWSTNDSQDQTPPLGLPTYFSDLTDLIILWCDVKLNNVDSSSLADFRRIASRVSEPQLFVEPPHAEIDECSRSLDSCASAVRRINLAAEYEYGSKDASSADKWETGVYGLSICPAKMLIRRDGFTNEIDLSKKPIRWHVFIKAFEAQGEQIKLSALKDGYSGVWRKEARTQIYREVAKELGLLGLTLKDRQIMEANSSE